MCIRLWLLVLLFNLIYQQIPLFRLFSIKYNVKQNIFGSYSNGLKSTFSIDNKHKC